MFTKANESAGFKEAETIIGPSVKIKGEFHCQGNMIIDGIVEGNIKTEGDLYVGEKAVINADISSNNAKISGKITGNLNIKGYLDITDSAKISGDIEIESLSIAKGAYLNGKCIMNGSEKIKTDKTEK